MTSNVKSPDLLNDHSRPAGPTRARYSVIAFIVGLAAVTYLDRACMGNLG